MNYVYFKTIKVGDEFICNGVKYRKQSTRTGLNLEVNRVFYFGKMELCQEI